MWSGGWKQFETRGDGGYRAVISFPVEAAGDDLSQLLNVVLGNISLKPAIRAEDLELPPACLADFAAPDSAGTGLRELTGVGPAAAGFHGVEADGLGGGRPGRVGLSLRVGRNRSDQG